MNVSYCKLDDNGLMGASKSSTISQMMNYAEIQKLS